MVSYDLPRSMVTSQVAFNQRALHSTPEIERAMDLHCQELVSKSLFYWPALFCSKELFSVELILVKSYKKCFKNYQNAFGEIGCVSFIDLLRLIGVKPI